MNKRQKIIGNWKMHGKAADVAQFARALTIQKFPADIIVCPPATLLPQLSGLVVDTGIKSGGQDCHIHKEGAHTGDICAAMLKEAGAEYVIVGHSERRAAYGESDALVKAKAEAAYAAGLMPIICVGESEADRQSGKAIEVVTRQVSASAPKALEGKQIIVAYEPIWAIGAGRTPSTAEIAEMHRAIARELGAKLAWQADSAWVVYGGSVKPDNAAGILSIKEVDGVLVGGASLKAESFAAIIAAART